MRTEILAGITTFITVAYILILNPQILADPFVITGDVAMAAKVSMVCSLVLVSVRLSEPFSVLFMLKYHWHRHLEWD